MKKTIAGLLLTGFLLGTTAYAATDCKKTYKQYEKLTPEQQMYVRYRADIDHNEDVNFDGKLDNIVLESQSAIAKCRVGRPWDEKETALVYTDGDSGKKQLFNWRGALPMRVMIHKDTKKPYLEIIEQRYDGTEQKHKVTLKP